MRRIGLRSCVAVICWIGLACNSASGQPAKSAAARKAPAAKVVSEPEYRAACDALAIGELTADPDKFRGRNVKFSGKILVMDFPQGDGAGKTPYGIILSVSDPSHTLESGVLPLFVSFTGTTDAFIYDQVTIYGEVKGKHTYSSVQIKEKTLPRVDAKYLDKDK